MTATIAALVLALLKIVSAVLSVIDKRMLVQLGVDTAMKNVLVEIIRRVGISHEVDAEVAGMSDDAVIAGLQKYVQPVVRPDARLILPGDGNNKVPGSGAGGFEKSANG
jgi:hypothetical protein